MGVKATSLAAYLERDFSKARAEVMRVLMVSQKPMTCLEILDDLRSIGLRRWEYGAVAGRVNWLIDCGALVKTGKCTKNVGTNCSANFVDLAPRYKRAAKRYQEAA